jgi:hypothetical protein
MISSEAMLTNLVSCEETKRVGRGDVLEELFLDNSYSEQRSGRISAGTNLFFSNHLEIF